LSIVGAWQGMYEKQLKEFKCPSLD